MGVSCNVPVMTLYTSLNSGSIFLTCVGVLHMGAQYSAGAWHKAKVVILSVRIMASHLLSVRFLSNDLREPAFLRSICFVHSIVIIFLLLTDYLL